MKKLLLEGRFWGLRLPKSWPKLLIVVVFLLCSTISQEEGETCHDYSSEMKNILWTMGNVLLDITVECSDSYLAQYEIELGDSLTLDWMENKPFLPSKEDLLEHFGEENIKYSPGGSALNTFRAFQWLMNEGPGISTFLGSIGRDEWGEILKMGIALSGVEAKFYVHDEVATGTCISLVSESNERTLIADLSASSQFPSSFLLESEENMRLMKESKMYYYTGYFLPVYYEGVLLNAKLAKEQGKVFGIGFSSDLIISVVLDELVEIMGYSTHVFSNKREARHFAKSMGWEGDDSYTTNLEEIGRSLALFLPSDPLTTIVITQGEEETLTFEQILTDDGEKDVILRSFDVEKSENMVDSNGAGDSFVGGFLASLAKGGNLESCIRAGQYVSKLIVESSGVTFPDDEPEIRLP